VPPRPVPRVSMGVGDSSSVGWVEPHGAYSLFSRSLLPKWPAGCAPGGNAIGVRAPTDNSKALPTQVQAA